MAWLAPVLALLCASGVVLNLSLSSLAKAELDKRDIEPGWLTQKLASKWDAYEEQFGSYGRKSSKTAALFFNGAVERIAKLAAAVLVLFVAFLIGPFLIRLILSIF